MKKAFVGIILLLMIGYFMIYSPQRTMDKQAPDFSTSLIDGTDFTLSDLKGNYVLLDFWGSWCGPCRRDNPNLVALYNRFHDQAYSDAENFELVTIALEKNERNWKKAAAKDGFSWKNQIVRTAKLVLTDPIAIRYGVKEVPAKFLIGPNGNIIGVNQSKEEIANILQAQLKQ